VSGHTPGQWRSYLEARIRSGSPIDVEEMRRLLSLAKQDERHWTYLSDFADALEDEAQRAGFTIDAEHGLDEAMHECIRRAVAAPEMLEALRELLDALGLRESIEFPSRKACDRYEVAYREARAAIAQAEGGVA